MKNGVSVTKVVAIVLLMVFTLVGCNDPFGSEDDKDKGTAPQIHQVILGYYNSINGQFSPTYRFAIGERADALISASDPDLDMATLTTKTTHVDSRNADTYTIRIEGQPQVDMTYLAYMEIIGPVGEWKVEFQITDREGNNSA
jgi:hypothetical protein